MNCFLSTRIPRNAAAWLGLVLAGAFGFFVARPLNSGAVLAAQTVPAPAAVLKVEGAVPTPLALTADDLAKMPQATAAITSDGNTSTYNGVLLYDILVRAGWKFGREMTGKPMASYLIATAKDGYQVVFALWRSIRSFPGQR